MDKNDIEAQIDFVNSSIELLDTLIKTYSEANTKSFDIMKHVIYAIKDLNDAKYMLIILNNRHPKDIKTKK